MKLYLDASAGLSGDMMLAAMIDLGLPVAEILEALQPLGLSGVKILGERGKRGTRLHYQFPRAIRLPRRIQELRRWMEQSALKRSLKGKMIRILQKIGQAEAAAHGTSIDHVRLHQLARPAVWINVAGFLTGLERWRISRLYVSRIPLGSLHRNGSGRLIPRPGPATERLLKGFRIRRLNDPFEWTTPTGAALLTCFGSREEAPPFRVKGIGHGVGQGRPPRGEGRLRLFLGEIA